MNTIFNIKMLKSVKKLIGNQSVYSLFEEGDANL